MKSLVVAVAGFIAGAVLGGALVDLAIEYGLMALDIRTLGMAMLIGGVAAAIAVHMVRSRRSHTARAQVSLSARNGEK